MNPSEAERLKNCESMPKKDIILLGPPGSGKGTQSSKIVHDFCYCQLSTGDLLREAVAKKTPDGIKAKEAMDKGQLVSDEIVNNLLVGGIRSEQCKRGIIFDGYPRNEAQAGNLENLLTGEGRVINHLIELKVEEEALYERVEGRRIHLPSGRSYHVKFNPPKVEGKDDVTGEPLIHRSDDTREVIHGRIGVYNQKTKPVAGYFEKKGVFSSVNAMEGINTISDNIRNILI